jgi:hypothetical protein
MRTVARAIGPSWCGFRASGGTACVLRFSPRTKQREADAVAELSTKKRERLSKSQFAYVDSDGGEHLPIHDESHVRNAISRFSQTHFESKAAKERARKKVLRAAERFGVEVSDEADVRQPAR